MSITKTLLQKIQEVSENTQTQYTVLFDFNFLRDFEKEAKSDQSAARILSKMEKQIDGITIQDIERWRELYTNYGEARYYFAIKSKGLNIEAIPESSEKTPDFKISFDNQTMFGEVKSFSPFGGNYSQLKAMEEGTDRIIQLEEEAKSKGFAMTASTHDPLDAAGRGGDSSSVRFVAESFIEKFNQNFKSGQFAQKPTISLMYMHTLQFPLIAHPSEAAIIASYPIRGEAVSGELWHGCFGRKGDKIFRLDENGDSRISDGHLSTDGILVAHEEFDGIAFFVELFSNEKLLYLHRTTSPQGVKEFGRRITDHYNDERHSEDKRLNDLIPSGIRNIG